MFKPETIKLLMRIHCMVVIIVLTSCEAETVTPCTPQFLDSKSYRGNSNICSGFPGEQKYFLTKATIMTNDSLLNITLESLDTSIIFFYNTIVTYECIEGEPGLFGYHLYENNNQIGQIGLQAISLYMDLFVDSCLNSSSFEGALIR